MRVVGEHNEKDQVTQQIAIVKNIDIHKYLYSQIFVVTHICSRKYL